MEIYTILKTRRPCRHFDEQTALPILNAIRYTDSDGKEHHGPHWDIKEIEKACHDMTSQNGVTIWDKAVAMNSFYADTCKTLTEAQALKAGHEYFFEDEDAPDDKIWRYFEAMSK